MSRQGLDLTSGIDHAGNGARGVNRRWPVIPLARKWPGDARGVDEAGVTVGSEISKCRKAVHCSSAASTSQYVQEVD